MSLPLGKVEFQDPHFRPAKSLHSIGGGRSIAAADGEVVISSLREKEKTMHAPQATHIDIPMGDVTYRVGQFSPRTGSFILMQVSTKLLPAFAGGAIRFKGMPFSLGGTPMTEEEFYVVQNHCLAVCSRIGESGTPAPIMMANGKLDPAIAHDFPAVMALTIHALKFNIEPFFSEDNPALASLGSLFPTGRSSKDSQTSMDSPGDQ